MFLIDPYRFGAATLSSYLAVAYNSGGVRGVSVYPFTALGFGTKVSDPSGGFVANGKGVTFSKNGAYIAVASDGSPYINVWPWTGAFGGKYADPAVLPTTGANGTGGVAFTDAADAIAVGHLTSPYISAYAWSAAGFGAKKSAPVSLITGGANSIDFSPAGDAIAIAHTSSPFIAAYDWSASGFGSKYANPGATPTPPNANTLAINFSPDGSHLIVGTSNGGAYIYPWTHASGFGTRYAGIVGLTSCTGASFRPDGSFVALSHTASPYISVYPFTNGVGFGAKIADPASLPAGAGSCIAWAPDGTALAVGHAASPFVSAYPFSGTFGSKYSDPSSLPSTTVLGISFM